MRRLQQNVDGHDEVEIGYSFLRSQWNRGFATEAATACRDFGFDTLRRTHLVSLIDPGTAASARVARNVGMSLEKEIERWGKRIHVYSVHASGAATAVSPARPV